MHVWSNVTCSVYAVTSSDIYFSAPFSECTECNAYMGHTPLLKVIAGKTEQAT
jgi:hypothetical protein